MSTEPQAPPRMSLDEIEQILTDIARNGEGAERYRAIKTLTGMHSAEAALPKPLTEDEVLERTSRLLLGIGRRLAFQSMQKAFGSKATVMHKPYAITEPEAPPELVARADKVFTVKDLYYLAPELKRRGPPKGFPTGRSPETKVRWLRRTALRILIDRANEAGKRIAEEARTMMPDYQGDDESPETV